MAVRGRQCILHFNRIRLRSCPIPTACNSSQFLARGSRLQPAQWWCVGCGLRQQLLRKGSQSQRGEDFRSNYPFASVFYAALLGSAGHRLYQAGADYTLGTLTGNGLLSFGSTQNYTVQAGASPIYDNGETTAIATFWATASANLFLQRLATTGYLFQPRFGTRHRIQHRVEFEKGFQGKPAPQHKPSGRFPDPDRGSQ